MKLPDIGKFAGFYGGASRLAARLLAEKAALHKWESPDLREYVRHLERNYPELATVPKEVELFQRNGVRPLLAALVENRAAYLEYMKRQQDDPKE